MNKRIRIALLAHGCQRPEPQPRYLSSRIEGLIVTALVIGLALPSPSSAQPFSGSIVSNILSETSFDERGVPADPTGDLPPSLAVRIGNPMPFGLCALIYVFDAGQQMQECCGCPVSSNGLLILSVSHDLTSRAASAATLDRGIIYAGSIFSRDCDPKGGKLDAFTTGRLDEWLAFSKPGAVASQEEFTRAPFGSLLGPFAKACGPIVSHSGSLRQGICTCGNGVD